MTHAVCDAATVRVKLLAGQTSDEWLHQLNAKLQHTLSARSAKGAIDAMRVFGRVRVMNMFNAEVHCTRRRSDTTSDTTSKDKALTKFRSSR